MSREIFKNLQDQLARQCPNTKILIDFSETAVKVFVEGLEKCQNEMSFMAITITHFQNDPEGLRMASEIDCFKTCFANIFKYDYPTIVEKFDLDVTTDKNEEGVQVWLHARKKINYSQ